MTKWSETNSVLLSSSCCFLVNEIISALTVWAKACLAITAERVCNVTIVAGASTREARVVECRQAEVTAAGLFAGICYYNSSTANCHHRYQLNSSHKRKHGINWSARHNILITSIRLLRYDIVYLTCSKKLMDSQLSLSHGTNKKRKRKN